MKFDERSREKTLTDKLEQIKVEFSVYRSNTKRTIAFIRELNKKIDHSKPNFIIFIGYHYPAAAWLFINRFSKKLPYAVRLGGDPIEVPWKRLKNSKKHLKLNTNAQFLGLARHLFNKIFIRSIDTVIVVTKCLAQQDMFSKKRVFVMPPSITISDKAKLQYKLPAPPRKVKLLCVSNLNYYEKYLGIVEIIDSLNHIDTRQKFTLKILGGGDYLPMLRNRIKESIANYQIEVDGYQNDTSAYYQQADIFIYSSTLDAWPNVLMEAMAHGLPIVCNYNDSFSEVFSEAQRDFLYDPMGLETLEKDLQKLMSNSDFAAMRSQLSLDRINSINNNLINTSELEAWLHKVR